MPVAYLDISSELFTELLKAFQPNQYQKEQRKFIVTENALPDDAEFVRATTRTTERGLSLISLWVESEHFEEGQELPSPVCKTVYD